MKQQKLLEQNYGTKILHHPWNFRHASLSDGWGQNGLILYDEVQQFLMAIPFASHFWTKMRLWTGQFCITQVGNSLDQVLVNRLQQTETLD